MGIEIDNKTPLAALPLFLADVDGQPLLVIIAKGTFQMDRRGTKLAPKQLPMNVAGQHWADPKRSSYKYEPETAWMKPSTDVVLIGSAYPQKPGDRQVDVRMRIGPIDKTVRVFGHRKWVKRLGIVDMTNPVPLEPTPLIYERAFGGWDSAEPDVVNGRFEARNPVGVGFRRRVFEEEMPLPNLEDPKHPLRMYGDTPPPAGFGFLSPDWQPRAQLAGTYDKKWQDTRSPLLPVDFDLRFFNAASPGCVAPEYLTGRETLTIENVSPDGPWSVPLPAIGPPKARVVLRGVPPQDLETKLDTVIVNTDERLLLLLWRTHIRLRNGPHDVREIVLGSQVGAELPDEMLTAG